MSNCLYCEQPFRWNPEKVDFKKGDVYSLAGKKEVGITGLCEFCFDEITDPGDDEEQCSE